MKRAHLVLLFVLACATSCAPAISPELRRAAAQVEILGSDETGGREFEMLRELRGVSCAKSGTTREEDARYDLRLKAARFGAHAIINTLCKKDSGASLDCVTCTGDAVHWIDNHANE